MINKRLRRQVDYTVEGKWYEDFILSSILEVYIRTSLCMILGGVGVDIYRVIDNINSGI